MDGRRIEGGSLKSEGGRYERRKINDVAIPGIGRLPYIDRDYWIDYAIRSGVDFERLPRMPFWANAAGYSDAWYRSVAGADVKNVSYLAQRPLTQEEAQHVAVHSANKCRATTHYTPMWMSATGYLWWRGWNSYRFPFYTPEPSSLSWVSKRLFSPIGIKPAHASFIFHALRLAAYSSITTWAMSFFFSMGPTAIFASGLYKDKALESLNKDMIRVAERQRQQPRRTGAPMRPVGQPQMGTTSRDEPADPRVAEFEELQRQAQPEELENMLQPMVPVSTMPTRRAEPAEPQYNDAGGDGDDPFDDASPVAPSAARRQQNLDASTPVGGSAWTRLRTKAFVERTQEQANEGSAALPRTSSWEERRQQSLQGGGSSYTYSQERQQTGGNDDRSASAAAARSREQAQREFDAMLERERKGSD